MSKVVRDDNYATRYRYYKAYLSLDNEWQKKVDDELDGKDYYIKLCDHKYVKGDVVFVTLKNVGEYFKPYKFRDNKFNMVVKITSTMVYKCLKGISMFRLVVDCVYKILNKENGYNGVSLWYSRIDNRIENSDIPGQYTLTLGQKPSCKDCIIS